MAELSVVVPSRDLPQNEKPGSGPIAITYTLTGELATRTTVLGEARNIANVEILAGTLTAWSAALTQQAPEAMTPYEIVIGNAAIEAGAVFRLTIPTAIQAGQVMLKCVLKQHGVSTPFAAQIASWKLTD